MATIIIDNRDSFTYNLAQYVGVCGVEARVLPNTVSLRMLQRQRPSALILSPGPGTADDPACLGVTLPALAHFAGRLPILGVCLGHQAIGKYFGARIRRCGSVRHGRISSVRLLRKSALFSRVPRVFDAMRYHSLVVDDVQLPACLHATCVAEDDAELMGLEHATQPTFGVQFHPESIGTQRGLQLIRNFLRLSA